MPGACGVRVADGFVCGRCTIRMAALRAQTDDHDCQSTDVHTVHVANAIAAAAIAAAPAASISAAACTANSMHTQRCADLKELALLLGRQRLQSKLELCHPTFLRHIPRR